MPQLKYKEALQALKPVVQTMPTAKMIQSLLRCRDAERWRNDAHYLTHFCGITDATSAQFYQLLAEKTTTMNIQLGDLKLPSQAWTEFEKMNLVAIFDDGFADEVKSKSTSRSLREQSKSLMRQANADPHKFNFNTMVAEFSKNPGMTAAGAKGGSKKAQQLAVAIAFFITGQSVEDTQVLCAGYCDETDIINHQTAMSKIVKDYLQEAIVVMSSEANKRSRLAQETATEADKRSKLAVQTASEAKDLSMRMCKRVVSARSPIVLMNINLDQDKVKPRDIAQAIAHKVRSIVGAVPKAAYWARRQAHGLKVGDLVFHMPSLADASLVIGSMDGRRLDGQLLTCGQYSLNAFKDFIENDFTDAFEAFEDLYD